MKTDSLSTLILTAHNIGGTDQQVPFGKQLYKSAQLAAYELINIKTVLASLQRVVERLENSTDLMEADAGCATETTRLNREALARFSFATQNEPLVDQVDQAVKEIQSKGREQAVDKVIEAASSIRSALGSRSNGHVTYMEWEALDSALKELSAINNADNDPKDKQV